MKQSIEIMHLSDTHILKDTKESLIETVYPKEDTNTNIFEELLKELLKKHPNTDCIVISGDLIHEGKAEDYIAFKSILERNTNIPVFLSLGNHDRRREFEKAFSLKEEESYYYSTVYSGFRFIVLDSSIDGSEDGEISKKQLDWLQETLKQPAEKGTFLIFHHPIGDLIAGNSETHCLRNSLELLESIEGSDVRGILSGHTHQSTVTILKNISSIVAGSTAFGVSFDEEFMYMNNDINYNMINLTEEDITVFSHNASPKEVLLEISIKELLETMNNQQEEMVHAVNL